MEVFEELDNKADAKTVIPALVLGKLLRHFKDVPAMRLAAEALARLQHAIKTKRRDAATYLQQCWRRFLERRRIARIKFIRLRAIRHWRDLTPALVLTLTFYRCGARELIAELCPSKNSGRQAAS